MAVDDDRQNENRIFRCIFPERRLTMRISSELEGRKVKIITIDGEEFIGNVSDYIYPEDNESEAAMLAIENCPQRPGKWIGLYENEIKSVQVIS